MNIEKEIFDRYEVNTKKLEQYGFIYNNDKYIYKKNILNDKFLIIIEYDKNIKGKIFDLEVNDEYINFRRETLGEFNSKIKEKFVELLTDIRDKCFDRTGFINPQTRRINDYIINKYNVNPEFLWDKYPLFGVYRNKNNKKWFALIGNVKLSSIDKKTTSNEMVELINLKINELVLKDLILQKGFYEAYHMNKKSWITIILNDTLKDELIHILIDDSYDIINEVKK